jgi:hypothetical protein
MNQVFDLNRWFLYTARHWNENKRKYLISLAAIAGLLILWYSFIIMVTDENPIGEGIQFMTFYVGLFLTGCLHASLIFSDLNEGPRAMHYLLLPASVFEKLLTAILFTGVLFFISYLLIFYLVDFSLVKISNSIAGNAIKYKEATHAVSSDIINVFKASPEKGDNFYMYFLLAFIGVQSAFLLGSVYFVKYNFIKTTVSVLVVFLFFIFLVHKVMHLFLPEGGFFLPFNIYRLYTDKGTIAIQLPEWMSTILNFLFKYTLAPTLWVATYFRLKEKEV